jgi:hypothetical protein
MKKTLLIWSFSAVILTASTAFVTIQNNSGRAGVTGAPGESTCGAAGCHSGGSSTSHGATVTATPSFTNDEYIPNTTYNVTLTVASAGFTKFGFGCEILNASNANIGLMQGAGSGVKFLTAGNGRKNAVQTTAKTGASGQTSFSFQWVAPAVGEGDATFYYCGNAVNGTGGTGGDFVFPGNYTLTEGIETITTTVTENKTEFISKFSVFPNPTSERMRLSYALKETKTVSIDLYDITGKMMKVLISESQKPGLYEKTISLQDIEKGIYFVRINSEGVKVSQKMLIVN